MGGELEQKVELHLSGEGRPRAGILCFHKSDSDAPLPLRELPQAARVEIAFPTREQPNFSMVCASWKSDIQNGRLEFLVKEKDNELANITFELSESDQRLLKSVTKETNAARFKGVAVNIAGRALKSGKSSSIDHGGSKNELRLKSSEIKPLNQ